MSFMEKIFGTRPVNTLPADNPGMQAQNNQQQVSNNPMQNTPTQGTAQSPGTAPNGVIPADGAGGPAKEETPLAEFKDLWQPVKADPNAPKPEEPITPAQMMEAASKVDFSKVISQEDLTKISAGGTEAQGAFASAMNKVAQAAYGQSAVVTSRLVEQAVLKAEEKFAAQLPNLIKRHTLVDSAENPAFQNPAVAPILAAIQSQLVEKYPKASTAELREMSKKILSGTAELITPKQASSSSTGRSGKEETDWENWISTGA